MDASVGRNFIAFAEKKEREKVKTKHTRQNTKHIHDKILTSINLELMTHLISTAKISLVKPLLCKTDVRCVKSNAVLMLSKMKLMRCNKFFIHLFPILVRTRNLILSYLLYFYYKLKRDF